MKITPIAFTFFVSCLVVATAQVHDDCFAVLYDLGGCIPYLSKEDNLMESADYQQCCSEFETVMKAGQHCLCYAVKHSEKIGLDLSFAKVETLPSLCKHITKPSNLCSDIDESSDLSPSKSPPQSPKAAPSPESATAPNSAPPHAPPPKGKSHGKAPPPVSGACSVPISISVLIAVLLASFYVLV